MQERSNVQPDDTPASAPTGRLCRSGVCPLQSRRSLLLWAVLIGALVYMQWPMLKGMYYKTTGTAAPV